MSEETKPLVLLYRCAPVAPFLRDRGYATTTVRSLKQLVDPTEHLEARVIVLGSTSFQNVRVSETLPRIRDRWPMVDVVVVAPKASGVLVRDALNAGAKDVLMSTSPSACATAIADIVEAQKLLPRAAHPEEARSQQHDGIHTRNPRMWDVLDLATRVAPTEATVLILGETGTGKELLARAIHRKSERPGRFVPVNCGAVSETLVGSELFGHVKGAFTGATSSKDGLFRHAESGTLFLDEIGNVPLTAQYHLLRALQEGTIRPVGSHAEIQVDVRVLAATSVSLEEEVERGRFREDLFYRLDVIRLDVPPLRERPEDIVYLYAHFARKIAEEYNVARPEPDDTFLESLVGHEWPGNVRELENFTERLVLTAAGRPVNAETVERLLPAAQRDDALAARGRSRFYPVEEADPQTPDVEKTMEECLGPKIATLESSYVAACLAAENGRVGAAAERAGISRRTLLRKMKEHGIDKARFRGRDREA